MSFCEVGPFADVAYMQLGVHYEEHVHGFPMGTFMKVST